MEIANESSGYARPYVMPPGPESQRHPAQLDPHRPHLPRRPLWVCRVCPDMDWPCPPARLLLAVEYRRNLAGLAVYMGQQLAAAMEDLGRLDTGNPPDGNALYERFIRSSASERYPSAGREGSVEGGSTGPETPEP